VVAAFVSLLAGYAVFLRAGVQPDYPTVLLPALLLIGLAFGLGFSSLSVAATAGVPAASQGLAASLFQTSFQVGGAVVLAVVTAVVDAGGASHVESPAATLAAYRPALVLITAIAAAGMLVGVSGLSRRRTTVPDQVSEFAGAGQEAAAEAERAA
jgi:sugar phosphate permease